MAEDELIAVPGTFGQFLVERELGRGGMGGVYLGRDKMLDRPVAIKVMNRELGADAAFTERFQREAQAAARLIHPNIAQIYSFGQQDGLPYIAMELVAGGSLDKLMEVKGAEIEPGRVMKVARQIAEALSCASDQGLVHGDVKPENILFDSSGNPKLVDFGLAAMQKETDEVWGTPYYISPEKIQRQPVDFRSDMFSLGATIYHALTGVAPFEGEDAAAVVKARLEGPGPRKPSEVRAGLSPLLDNVLLKMLARDPANRYPSYEALLADIAKVMTSGLAGATAAPPKPAPSGGPRIKLKTRKSLKLKRPGESKPEDAEEPAEAEDADGDETGNGEDDETVSPKKKSLLKKGKKIRKVETDRQPAEEEGMALGKMVGLVILGVVLVIALVAGGLAWYISHTKEVERREHQKNVVDVMVRARSAIAKTVKAADDFGRNFSELAQKVVKDMASATDQMKRQLTPEIIEAIGADLTPPKSKDVEEAIAYRERLFAEAAAAESAAIAATSAPPAQVEAPAAATNAPAAATNAPAAVATNAPAAATANAPAAAATNAPAAAKRELTPDEQAELDLKAQEAAVNGSAPEKKDGGEAGDGKKAEAAAEEAPKPEEPPKPPVEVPSGVKQFIALWADAYFCEAADIRVQARIEMLHKLADRQSGMTSETEESAAALGALNKQVLDEFDAIKQLKCVEQMQRKAGVVKAKAPMLIKSVGKDLARAKAKAEKEAKEKAEKEAREAEEARRAAEYKARTAEEIQIATAKFDQLAQSHIRTLTWDIAVKQMKVLEDDFRTDDGRFELRERIYRIEWMRDVHQQFIKHVKGFTFGPPRKQFEVTAVDEKFITYRINTVVKQRPVPGKAQKVTWNQFYAKQKGMLNRFVIEFVEKARQTTKASPLDWSHLMLGSAMMMRTIYSDDPTVPPRVEQLVKKAVKDFEPIRKYAEKMFPEVTLGAAEE